MALEVEPMLFSEISKIAQFIDILQEDSLDPIQVVFPMDQIRIDNLKFIYQLSRALTFRINGGKLNDTVTIPIRKHDVTPEIEIFCDEETIGQALLARCPFIQGALDDNDLSFYHTSSSMQAPNKTNKISLLVVLPHVHDQYVGNIEFNHSLCLVIRNFNKSSEGIQHSVKNRTSTILLKPSTRFEFTQSIQELFTECMTFPFDVDFDFLRLLTSQQSQKAYQNKLVIDSYISRSKNDDDDNDDLKQRSLDISNIKVWSSPSSSGSVQYSLAVLRLAGMDPNILSSILPLLAEKVIYLRNTSANLSAEVIESLELSMRMHVPDDAASSFLFDKVIRLLMQLNALPAALRVASLCIQVNGEKSVLSYLLKGRCLEAMKRSCEAVECFSHVLSLEPSNSEAKLALTRLSKHRQNNEYNKGDDDVCEPSKKKEEIGAEEEEDKVVVKSSWARMVSRAQQRALENEGYTCLQQRSRVSKSIVYELMRNFYDKKGMNAWGNGEERRNDIVPFYITSNPKIAKNYADVVIGLLRDMKQQNKVCRNEPLYIIELGTGPGKFSCLFLKYLQQFLVYNKEKNAFFYDGTEIIYIMTDFTQINVNAWESDEVLAGYVQSGLCDFALYDCDGDSDEIHLLHKNITLSPNNGKNSLINNPVVVIANYLFDSIRMDAFRAKGNGKLCEALLSTYAKNTSHHNESSHESDLDVSVAGSIKHEWSYPLLDDLNSYYEEEAVAADEGEGQEDTGLNSKEFGQALAHVLKSYARDLEADACFSIPISGLKILDTFRRMTSKGNVAMLVADKGHNRVSMLNHHKGNPLISLHGSLSMMVNFDAISRFVTEYAKLMNISSSVIHTPQQNSNLDICVISLGFRSRIASSVFMDRMALFGVYDLFTVRDHIEDVLSPQIMNQEEEDAVSSTITKSNNVVPLPVLVSLLRLSCWDPDLLGQFSDAIIYQLDLCPSFSSLTNPLNDIVEECFDSIAAISELRSHMHDIMEAHTPRFDRDNSLLDSWNKISEKLASFP